MDAASSPVVSRIDLRCLRQERLARLRAALARADVAGGVFFDPINIRYATDVSNMQIWSLHNAVRYVFVATQGPVVLFEFSDGEHLAEGLGTVDETRPAISAAHLMAGATAAERHRQWASEIADLMHWHGGGNTRLAVDHLDWHAAGELANLGISAVAGQPIAEDARGIKTADEIQLMRAAIASCEDAVRLLEQHCQPGITEHELWSILHRENIASGGEWIETRLLASGPRTNPWYQECSAREIESGDLVALDTDLIGTMGYCCDISRTWRAGGGRPSARQQRTYADAHAHLMRLLECVGPGVTLAEIAEVIGPKPGGYRAYGCLIHGVGMCDEYPVAYWQGQAGVYDEVLKPGMTICVESYLGPEDGSEGVKLEEQVLVTESGIEVLSSLPFHEDWL